MYHVTIDGKDTVSERLQWVKSQTNGVYILCSEAEGQGLVIDGEIYHVSGRTSIDMPTVELPVWKEDETTETGEVADIGGVAADLA